LAKKPPPRKPNVDKGPYDPGLVKELIETIKKLIKKEANQ
jgi:hypothetical protein